MLLQQEKNLFALERAQRWVLQIFANHIVAARLEQNFVIMIEMS